MPFNLNPRVKAFMWLMLSFNLIETRQKRILEQVPSHFDPGGGPLQLDS